MAFRFLGLLAALDAKLGGNSLNLYAVKLLLIFTLVVFTMAGARHLTSVGPSTDPRPVSLADLASGQVPVGTYVTVEGAIDPRYRIEMTSRSWSFGRRRVRSATSTSQMLPLVDDSRRTGLLITSPAPASSGRVSLIGTVARLPDKARDTLARDQAALPSRMHPELMLASGRREPASTGLNVALVVICGPLAALLLYVRLKRGLIFRARPLGDGALAHGEVREIDVRLTGRLRLGTGAARRFVEMPAQATVGDRGEVVLGQNIDASLYLYEFCLRTRIGFWSLSIQPGTLGAIVRGEIAMGNAVRPAAKVRIEGSGGAQTITLSFATVAQREYFLCVLVQRCGQAASRAA
jgi:hypothetical protein